MNQSQKIEPQCYSCHYKKRADLRRVFSQRRGGSNRPHGAPAVKFTAGDFNEGTLRWGGTIYAVAPSEPPLRVGANVGAEPPAAKIFYFLKKNGMGVVTDRRHVIFF